MALLTFMLTALFLGATRQCKAEDYERRILWENAEHTAAAFIPEKVLHEKQLSELPLSENTRPLLEGALYFRRNYPPRIPVSMKENPCEVLGKADPAGSYRHAKSLDELIADTPVALVGKVVEIVPGWLTTLAHAGKAVYFVVDTILKAPEEAVKLGDIRAFEKYGGEITLDGVRLCTEAVPGFYSPRLADRILLVGAMFPYDELRLVGTTFPIEKDLVLIQPYPWVRDLPTRSLAQTVDGAKKQQGGRP